MDITLRWSRTENWNIHASPMIVIIIFYHKSFISINAFVCCSIWWYFGYYERANPLGSRCSHCRSTNHFSQLCITYAKICVCRTCRCSSLRVCVCVRVNEWLIECDLIQNSMHIATMREMNVFSWRCNRPLATHVTQMWWPLNTHTISARTPYGPMRALFYIPATNINADNKIILSKITAIAVHFHEHFAANPFRKFNGAE